MVSEVFCSLKIFPQVVLEVFLSKIGEQYSSNFLENPAEPFRNNLQSWRRSEVCTGCMKNFRLRNFDMHKRALTVYNLTVENITQRILHQVRTSASNEREDTIMIIDSNPGQIHFTNLNKTEDNVVFKFPATEKSLQIGMSCI